MYKQVNVIVLEREEGRRERVKRTEGGREGEREREKDIEKERRGGQTKGVGRLEHATMFRVILCIVCGLCGECGAIVVGGAFPRSKR